MGGTPSCCKVTSKHLVNWSPWLHIVLRLVLLFWHLHVFGKIPLFLSFALNFVYQRVVWIQYKDRVCQQSHFKRTNYFTLLLLQRILVYDEFHKSWFKLNGPWPITVFKGLCPKRKQPSLWNKPISTSLQYHRVESSCGLSD